MKVGTPRAYDAPGLDEGAAGPFAEAALPLLTAGWSPIPVQGKNPPAEGFTGRTGLRADGATIRAWNNRREGSWNVGIRLPDGVVGIDVDAHSGKDGAATLGRCETEWGSLPATWTYAARELPNGIRLYRAPAGMDLSHAEKAVRQYGNHVDVITAHHRYVLVAPSIHPITRTPYTWISPDGVVQSAPPSPNDLPELPAAWFTFTTTRSEKIRVEQPGPIRDEHSGPIAEGDRNEKLISYASHLRNQNMP